VETQKIIAGEARITMLTGGKMLAELLAADTTQTPAPNRSP
jgi:hypothetical protein